MSTPRIVVVGSGPIGATYARIVLDEHPTAQVLMVELGPRLTDRPGLSVRNIADPVERDAARLASQGPNSSGTLTAGSIPGGAPVIEGTFTARQGTHLIDDGSPHSGHSPNLPAAALSTNVGGQGAHWTAACPRPADDERIDFIGDEEWEQLIGEAETLLQVDKDAFHSPAATAIARVLGEEFDAVLPEGRTVGPLPVAVDVRPDGELVWTGTDTVLGPLLEPGTSQAARFELRARTQARRVIVEDGCARGVVLRDLETGREYEERADKVVVAADAIRTPQLLFASGMRPKALGRYLTEHPVILSTVSLPPEVVESFYPDGVPAQERLATSAGDEVSAVIRIPYSAEAFPFGAQIMHLAESPIPVPEGHPLARSEYGYVTVGFGTRKYPRVEDGLTFTEAEVDVFDMPNVTVDYALTDAELAEIEAAKAMLTRTAALLGEFLPGGEPRLAPNGSSLHYQGTFRIGSADDGTSVIDPWSRVWGVENLVLGGNGAIPTATVVNPTLFSATLAVRGAHQLVAELSQDAPEPVQRETIPA